MGKENLRINRRIRAREVRLVDENNEQVGVVSKDEALARADEVDLDLVEVAPNSDPPVCRIMDYGKWLYQQKRRVREAHKKHNVHHTTMKEIRLRPGTEKHDLDIKVKHAKEFLEKGHKVQFTLMFRGRQMLHTDKGYEVLDQICESLGDLAKIERPGKITGKRLKLVLVPK